MKRRARSKLALTCDHLQAARRPIADAIELATNVYDSFTSAPPKTRQLRKEAVRSAVHLADREVAGHEYEWPFGFMPKGPFRWF